MSGFESPNYTQTPNDFFSMLPEMGDAELRVTLVMIRKTFGFHKDSFKMGITKLAKAAGLSRQGALDGAKEAENRGTFRRTNPQDQTEAEWELIVPLQQDDTPSSQLRDPLQPVEDSPLAGGGQVGVKEILNKSKKDAILSEKELDEVNTKVDAMLDMANFPGAKTQVRIDAILSYLGETLHRNTETKEWRDFAKYVDSERQTKGWEVDRFIRWLLAQPDYQPQFWPPKKMKEFYPMAFQTPTQTERPSSFYA